MKRNFLASLSIVTTVNNSRSDIITPLVLYNGVPRILYSEVSKMLNTLSQNHQSIMKIICIGRNYGAHAAELGNAIPDAPLIFMKPSSALLIGNKPFYYPAFTNDLHYECELVLKVAKNGRSIEQKFAHRYYNEMALGIDFTARDLQSKLKQKGHPWEIAKGFDGSAVLSEFIPIEDRHRNEGVKFSMKKNKVIVQEGDTNNLIFSFDYLIHYVSQFFKLQMGDYIFTGTPAGVGPVEIGDVLEGSIEEQKMFHCEIK